MMQPVLTGGTPRTRLLARSRRRKQLAVSIHFPVWPDWRDAVRVLLRRARHITRVGISAGSADWTYFRSSHDRGAWSDAQQAQSEDVLEVAVEEFGEREICSTAVLDVLAPRYLQKQPQYAAVDTRGRRSDRVVCSTALAEGEYGRILADAFEALAAATRADSLAIANLHFGWNCYCARCRGRPAQMVAVVARLSAVARAHGKRLLLEAKLSRESGQDYALLRSHVDEFVVRDDLAVAGAETTDSAEAARHLCRTIGPDDYWHCVGLRGVDGHALAAPQMRLSLSSALSGGARRLWVAPSHYLSPLHWQQLDELLSRDDVAAAALE